MSVFFKQVMNRMCICAEKNAREECYLFRIGEYSGQVDVCVRVFLFCGFHMNKM